MANNTTHREVKKPQITLRHLADYMAARQRVERTIVRDSKYQPKARVIQHNKAKIAVSRFIRGEKDLDYLHRFAAALRNQMADSDFDRDVLDHNADYVERAAEISTNIVLPNGKISSYGSKSPAIMLGGVRVTTELFFRFRRLTRTNKIRIGIGALRYAKGKPLDPEVGKWQSAFLFGFLREINTEYGADPELKLCITIDAYSGKVHPAPTDAVRRYRDMEAACKSIAERWPNVEPPVGAIF